MKYAFIINPASGQGVDDNNVMPKVEELRKSIDCEIQCYFTEGAMDAAVLAEAISSEAYPDEVVIFACGGDGTIQEVANGIYGHDNAILGVYPCGSGNDFVRALGADAKAASSFLDLEKQVNGEVGPLDLMRLTYDDASGNGDKAARSRLVVNGINIGFDGNTAILAHTLKSLPGVSGSLSYYLSAAVNFIQKKGENLAITADGEEFYMGKLLLATAANGGFCGGGFESCPYADLTDGEIELFVADDIPRRKFPALIPKYLKGEIFQVPDLDQYASYRRAKEVVIEPIGKKTMKFVADGEIFETGNIKIEMLQHAIRVLRPAVNR